MNRKNMTQMIAAVARAAGGEAPRFAILHIRDWWVLRRGPKWRYPLPEPRVFTCLPRRGALARLLRDDRHALTMEHTRRAIVPSVFYKAYLAYGSLDPWINRERHRGRVKRHA